jgi:hypothetical protein
MDAISVAEQLPLAFARLPTVMSVCLGWLMLALVGVVL